MAAPPRTALNQSRRVEILGTFVMGVPCLGCLREFASDELNTVIVEPRRSSNPEVHLNHREGARGSGERPRRWSSRWWTWFVLVATATLGLVGVVVTVMTKVQSGAAAESYLTGEGYRFTYGGALVLLVAALVALVLGALVAWWQTRDETDFIRKYTRKPK